MYPRVSAVHNMNIIEAFWLEWHRQVMYDQEQHAQLGGPAAFIVASGNETLTLILDVECIQSHTVPLSS